MLSDLHVYPSLVEGESQGILLALALAPLVLFTSAHSCSCCYNDLQACLISSSTAKIHHFGGLRKICATGKTPLVFVEEVVKIDQNVHLCNILEAVVDPWVRPHLSRQQWTLQQDSTPAHSAN